MSMGVNWDDYSDIPHCPESFGPGSMMSSIAYGGRKTHATRTTRATLGETLYEDGDLVETLKNEVSSCSTSF